VIATQEAYSDTGSTSPEGWILAKDLSLPVAQVDGIEMGGVFPVAPELVGWATGVLEAADFSGGVAEKAVVLVGPCVTSSTVTGTDEQARALSERWGALAESMEGAAAAHVCALLKAPFLELRAISNVVGDRDRSKWTVDRAVETAGSAALALVAAWSEKIGA
jgi:futalosine hydrolase